MRAQAGMMAGILDRHDSRQTGMIPDSFGLGGLAWKDSRPPAKAYHEIMITDDY
jgi:hypothetical protein